MVDTKITTAIASNINPKTFKDFFKRDKIPIATSPKNTKVIIINTLASLLDKLK